MEKILKILFVEDVKSDAELIWRSIAQSGITFLKLLVESKTDYLERLISFNPDIIISDYSLPQFDGMTALLLRNEHAQFTPFILVTGSINEEVAVECMKNGADDYVLKDNLARLGPAINNSLMKIELLKQNNDAEIALRESEERFRILYNDAVVGLYRTNLEGEIFLANNTLVNMLGYDSFEELSSRNLNVLGFGHSSHRKQFIDRIEKEGQIKDFESVWVSRDGSEIFVKESARAIFDKNGNTIYFDGTVEDITDKKKAEKELFESEEKYRSIFENIQDLYYESTMDGKILEVSPSISILSKGQYVREDLIGKSMYEFYSFPGERELLMEALKSKGIITDFEIKLKNRDGSTIPCSISSKISFDSQGSPVKIIGSMRDISERKKAQEALFQSKREFQNYFESGSVGMSVTLPDKSWIEVNQKLCNMFGYSKSELINMTWLDVSHPDDVEENLELFEQALEGKIENYSLEKRFKRKDGKIVHVAISVVCERNPDRTVHHFLASYIDITERILAEEKIHSEQILLRTLIDNLPDPIYVLDKNCRKVIANKADVKNIGYDEEGEGEVIGKTDLELFPGQVGIRGHADNEAVIKSGKAIIEREEDFVDKEGNRRWLLTTKAPLLNKAGIVNGLVGIGHEITSRKKAEVELKQSYTFNESLLKTIPFGMDIVDETGTIMFQSDSFKRLFGEDTIGMKCWDLYRDDKKQCSDCPLTRGVVLGETESYESHGVLGNRIFDISHTGMMYQGKKAMLEIFQDITERKENEMELIEAKEKAEESDKLKTAFLHNISHEIRTPMNAIVGFSALLGEPELDAETRSSYIETIMQSSNHLLAIISDIVDISNIEANLVRVVENPININDLLRSLCNISRKTAEGKKINLLYDSSLSEDEALVVTDSTKITQIITNLLNNAIKFTDRGFVSVSCDRAGVSLRLIVSDSGIGIPAEFHSRIFERFFQVQNSVSRIYEGTGLGLAISKAYVEIMGGKIWVESEPGKGTIFSLTVPYKKQITKEKAMIDKPVSDSLIFKNKRKILVAEDIDSNYKLLVYFLKGTNTQIFRAINGKEAFEKCLSEKNIDLILMDIKMPVMDGYTSVKLIREANIRIPIIAQTAYVDDRSKALESGCDGFISKPFDKKGLLKVIGEYLQ
jgi:PAS domain S-box-containing protein